VLLSVGVAAVSTLLGGVRAVVWSDVLQFAMFVGGGLLALWFVATGYPGGFPAVLDAADAAGKTHVLVLDADPPSQLHVLGRGFRHAVSESRGLWH
jgi:SSS family solute:Na+ symporter